MRLDSGRRKDSYETKAYKEKRESNDNISDNKSILIMYGMEY